MLRTILQFAYIILTFEGFITQTSWPRHIIIALHSVCYPPHSFTKLCVCLILIYFHNNIDDKKKSGKSNNKQKHAKLDHPVPLMSADHQLKTRWKIGIFLRNKSPGPGWQRRQRAWGKQCRSWRDTKSPGRWELQKKTILCVICIQWKHLTGVTSIGIGSLSDHSVEDPNLKENIDCFLIAMTRSWSLERRWCWCWSPGRGRLWREEQSVQDKPLVGGGKKTLERDYDQYV